MKKSLAALALAGSIALVGAMPAAAANYPAPSESIVVSDASVAVGQPITITASGFTPGESVIFTIERTGPALASGGSVSAGSLSVTGRIPLAPSNATAVANGNGSASTQVVFDEAGTYAVTATGQTSGVVVGPVTVVVGTAALPNTGGNTGSGTEAGADLANTGGTPLANTGADSTLVLWSLVGAGALAAGTASVVVARRRAKGSGAAA
jgi:LPXTG-motif cell wall-anchored protein